MTLHKVLLTASFLLASAQSFADGGPYDGIWIFEPYGYAQVTERSGVMVAILNYNEDYGGVWEAFMGTRIDNYTRLTTIKGYVNSVFDLTVDSSNNATVTQISCTPTPYADCAFTNGTRLHGVKIW